MAFFDAPGFIMEVFISHLLFHTAFHCYPALPFLFPQSSAFYPIMSPSLSKSGTVKQLPDIPPPHDFETFHVSKDYEVFWKQVILPIICDSHNRQDISYFDEPVLLLPVSFTPSQPSIKSVYQLILDMDINSPNCIPFTHYVDYPPRQSAFIPITRRLTTMAILARTSQGALLRMTRWRIRRVI
jgi:hypothetical protein